MAPVATVFSSVKSSSSSAQSGSFTYIIKKGDTLGKLAAQYDTSVEKLQADNNIANKNDIKAGAKLIINK